MTTRSRLPGLLWTTKGIGASQASRGLQEVPGEWSGLHPVRDTVVQRFTSWLGTPLPLGLGVGEGK